MKIMAVALLILGAALGFQSLRVAHLQTDLAVMRGQLDAAETREALLDENGKTLERTRDGLAAQVEACQRSNAKAASAARDRGSIMKQAKAAPATGKVVDDETNARAARHINRAAGR